MMDRDVIEKLVQEVLEEKLAPMVKATVADMVDFGDLKIAVERDEDDYDDDDDDDYDEEYDDEEDDGSPSSNN